MKLNKIEKIIVVILVVGVILGVGIFMFVKPSFDQIGVEQRTLEAYQTELNELKDKLSRLDTIDADIQVQREAADKYEDYFYPEMTTYETSELAMAMLKAANLEAHSISVSNVSTGSNSLSYFLPGDISYTLKNYANVAKSDPSEEKEVLEEGQFKDGNKLYTVTVNSVADVTITDENGEEVAPSRYTETMQKVYKAAVCRYAASNSRSQTTARMTASFQINGTYKDYMAFVDHIASLEKATQLGAVIIPVTVSPETDKDEEEENNSFYVDESGFLVSQDEVDSDDQVLVTDDTEIEQSITLTFYAIDGMKEVTRVDADGTEIVVDQRPAVY